MELKVAETTSEKMKVGFGKGFKRFKKFANKKVAKAPKANWLTKATQKATAAMSRTLQTSEDDFNAFHHAALAGDLGVLKALLGHPMLEDPSVKAKFVKSRCERGNALEIARTHKKLSVATYLPGLMKSLGVADS